MYRDFLLNIFIPAELAEIFSRSARSSDNFFYANLCCTILLFERVRYNNMFIRSSIFVYFYVCASNITQQESCSPSFSNFSQFSELQLPCANGHFIALKQFTRRFE